MHFNDNIQQDLGDITNMERINIFRLRTRLRVVAFLIIDKPGVYVAELQPTPTGVEC